MSHKKLYSTLSAYVQGLQNEFEMISRERKSILAKLTEYIKSNGNKNPIDLIFICTHNSRRSHLSQIWAQTAAFVYDIAGVRSFSGGTEATAFNPRAVTAMRQAGFDISIQKEGDNPLYAVRFADAAPALQVFSKAYDDPFNPKENFAAVMTCSHADENCPVIPGVQKRIALTYDDPKEFDGTALEEEKYSERVREIGREILFAFSQVSE